ncbi:hypothetical protein [Saccharolobus caldissimus]|uniref:Uncharacterized protein n=1 Tax=Saccharolobus caldissimus TaxID=1702097 RepID=A0AAQ4CWT2_9CREN|nr:hypothetical protein [Saccharolobus caldissimus]BDC00264.1 hypothetical protein SACC_32800 [Saccharolobus caldissimus]
MEQIIEFPDVLELVEQHKLPREIYAPDGTLLFKPYDPVIESPLVTHRKTWRLFANYTIDPSDDEIVQINTTGKLIRIKHDADVDEIMGYVRKVHPGATVEEAISFALESTVEQTGEFKDDDEFGAYTLTLYLILAYLIHYGVLILVK